MADKSWLLEVGERGEIATENSEDLVKNAMAERKRKQIDRQEEIDELAHTAKVADLQKKTKESTAEADKVERKAEEGGFKVTGGVHLGTIDLQQERMAAQEELKRLNTEKENQIKQIGAANDTLRDKIQEQQNKLIELTFKSQMELMQRSIDSNKTTVKSFGEQYQEVLETTKLLGLTNSPVANDANVQIELKKMEFENQMALRQMSREDKRSDRQFQLELKKFDQERDFRQQELAQKEKRDAMFTGAPEMIGKVLAQGLKERAVSAAETTIAEKAPGKGRGFEAGVGEGGEVPCPECEQPIAIGATARQAVCANCGTTYPIKRMKVAEE